MPLCFACAETLSALELLRSKDVHSFVFCNSVFFADRSGMAASKFLVAASACVILLRFAADSRKSYCNGSVRRVNGALAADVVGLATDDFPFKSFKIPF